MKTLAGGAAFVAILFLANVVAAGVFLALWPIVRPADELVAVIAAALVGIVSVACAYFFIVGVMVKIPRWLSKQP